MKHLWTIAAKKDSLWVKWISIEMLKRRNFYEVSIEGNCSSIWKTLLELRDRVKEYIEYKICDGKKTLFGMKNGIIMDH